MGEPILTRDHYHLTNIVSAYWQGNGSNFQNVIVLTNYVPSGVERRDRENIFSNEPLYLLRGIPPSLLVEGYFNSVLANTEATEHPNYKRGLEEFIRGFDLVGMRETSHERVTHTHYARRGVSRIDRI